MKSSAPLASLVVSFALLAGCASPPPPQTPAAPTRPSSAEAPRPVSKGVAVASTIADECKLKVGNVESAPKFDFDKSDLDTSDRDVLAQIARCVTTGPLKGRALKLVGRADARGETEYNMTLGAHRADTAKSYLTSLGVDPKKVAGSSRGELDATGRDESGYERDRRVDITLQ